MTRLAKAQLIELSSRPGRFWDMKASHGLVMWAWERWWWPLCLDVAASLALDGSPGGRWPRARKGAGRDGR